MATAIDSLNMNALSATKPAQDAEVTTPTGQQLLGALGVTGIAVDPATIITTAATVGGIARLYESKPVRDAMIKLNSSTLGSTRFESALKELDSVVLSVGHAFDASASEAVVTGE